MSGLRVSSGNPDWRGEGLCSCRLVPRLRGAIWWEGLADALMRSTFHDYPVGFQTFHLVVVMQSFGASVNQYLKPLGSLFTI